MNWSLVLKGNADRFPNKECVIGLGHRLTYGQLHERSNALAQGLQDLGLTRGDIVAILLYNCCEYIEITFAVNQTGAIWLPMNFRLAGDEFRYILDNSEAKVLITEPEFIPVISSISEELPHL